MHRYLAGLALFLFPLLSFGSQNSAVQERPASAPQPQISSKSDDPLYKTVVYDLEGGVTYSKVKSDFFHEGAACAFTHPYHPLKKGNLPIIRSKNPVKVLQTTGWPYCFQGQLELVFDDGVWKGSGFMVGPHHLLTAAHCIFRNQVNQWVKEVTVRLALNKGATPFGTAKARRIYTFKEWITKGSPEFDMALIMLDRPLGFESGWMGLLALPDDQLSKEKAQITGYPATKGCKEMWEAFNDLTKIGKEQIHYEIEISSGVSGGAVWINRENYPYALGIHTYGKSGTNIGHTGCRLSLPKLKIITTQWMSSSYLRVEDPPTSGDRTGALAGNARTTPSKAEIERYWHTGLCLYQQGFYEYAATAISKAGAQGYAPAQALLGDMLTNGQGVQKNESKSVDWYWAAADQDYAEAQVQLAECYQTGRGITWNGSVATYWLRRAAYLGHPKAQTQIGIRHLNGIGAQEDFQEALKWFWIAAQQGDPEAQWYFNLLTMPQQ